MQTIPFREKSAACGSNKQCGAISLLVLVFVIVMMRAISLNTSEMVPFRLFASHKNHDSFATTVCVPSSTYEVKSLQLQATHKLHEFIQEIESSNIETTSKEPLPASCEWWKHPNSDHLPHAMQQLYRCFSWWKAYPDRESVLIPNQRQVSVFVKGFIASLAAAFNVSIVADDDHDHSLMAAARPIVEYTFDDTPNMGFSVKSPEDMQFLRERTIEYYKVPLRKGGCSLSTARARMHVPRIAILNRRGEEGRSFLMVEELQRSLSNATGAHVSLEYLEDQTYLNQVQFFAQTDILVSPHGAQLTGLPFMPRCGALLEIFPTGYFYPNYFGSLAASSGLSYSYLYAGYNLTGESETWMKNSRARKKARSHSICPNIQKIARAVEDMLDAWTSCCEETRR